MEKPKLFKPLHKKVSGSNRTFNGRAHIDAMYDLEWNKYSKKFCELNPRCYSCGARSEVTDHIKAHRGDPVLFKKLDNHLPLCAKCHNYITAKFDRKVVQDLNGKLNWIAANRSRNDLSFKVKVMAEY